MYDLKVINAVLSQLEEERGIPRERVLEAIEGALATAYKKEYGKRGHIIRAAFNPDTGSAEFFQVKIAVSPEHTVETKEERDDIKEAQGEEAAEDVVVFNPEQHIMLEDAQKIKSGVEPSEELSFPLEIKQDFGRIASQTAKQIIMQKIREAEKTSVLGEFSQREDEIVSGSVQRIERGTIFVDLGRATGVLLRDEQIPGERFQQGERVRALLVSVDDGAKGVFLKLSRSHPHFLRKLFEAETPELTSGTVEIKGVAREAGSRTKIAVAASEDGIDPVGAMVGQRGVRVSTVMSELGGEKIDIIEWSDEPTQFIEDAMSPAKVLNVTTDEENHIAQVEVAEDQQSLAIGRGGQNVRLAAKLTGWRIDVQSTQGEAIAEADAEGDVEVHQDEGGDVQPSADLGETVETVTQDESAKTSEENDEGDAVDADEASSDDADETASEERGESNEEKDGTEQETEEEQKNA